MQHNRFNLYLDILNPIYYFWKEINIEITEQSPIQINIDAILAHKVIIEYFKNKSKIVNKEDSN